MSRHLSCYSPVTFHNAQVILLAMGIFADWYCGCVLPAVRAHASWIMDLSLIPGLKLRLRLSVAQMVTVALRLQLGNCQGWMNCADAMGALTVLQYQACTVRCRQQGCAAWLHIAGLMVPRCSA